MIEDTIAAISTPSGAGPIAMIRLSGPGSWEILSSVFSGVPDGKTLVNLEAGRVHYGWIRDNERIIDEVLVTAFQSPRSYTGEDMIEISCHGSVFIQQELLNLMILKGARVAQPGEFTRRAFVNGKIDLSQAEGISDLIASSGAASHRLALAQMRGGFSDELARIRAQLLHFVSLVELELDFSEEDVEFADRKGLVMLINEMILHISRLVESFELGNAIKSGVPVAIVGETNTGKSTLLNALLREEKAIVSDIAGTTRDVIEDKIHLHGIEFRFIDTAGIRDTHDTIENLGIERAYRQISNARIILLMTDHRHSGKENLNWVKKISSHVRDDQHLILIVNKSDTDPASAVEMASKLADSGNANPEVPVVIISAKKGTGLPELEKLLLEKVQYNLLESADIVVTNARHYEALTRSMEALNRSLNGLHQGITADFLSQDIREALHYLGEITGTISTDEILGNIFKNFCIGK
jgi:tRNA modification GTPase